MIYDQLERIEFLIRTHKLKEAQKRIGELLLQYPDEGTLYQLQSKIEVEHDNYDKALELINTAVGLEPTYGDHFYHQSRILYLKRDFAAAMTSINTALDLEPSDPYFCGQKAMLLYQKEKRDEAIEWAKKGLETDPENDFCANVLSMVLGVKGDTLGAEAVLGDRLARNPEDAFSHANMGYNFIRKGNMKQAKVHFKEALLIDPEFQYAKDGMIEAIKGSNILYRTIVNYGVWMEKLTSKNQWFVIIGLLLVVNFLPVLIAPYLLFIAYIYLAPPIAHAILYYDTYGRYLMDDKSRNISIVLNFLLPIAIIAALFGLIISGNYFILAIAAMFATVPIYGLISRERTFNMLILTLFAGVFLVYGILSVLPMFADMQQQLGFMPVIGIAVVYTWVGNIFQD